MPARNPNIERKDSQDATKLTTEKMTDNNSPTNSQPINDQLMKKKHNKQKPMNNRQNNRLKRQTEMSAHTLKITTNGDISECATSPLTDSIVTAHELDCFPDRCENLYTPGRANEASGRFHVRFRAIPAWEFSRTKAHKYTCPEIGTVTAVVYNHEPWFRLSHISSISGFTADELHTCIYQDQFIEIKLFGKGDVSYEFMTWKAASLLCAQSDAGRLFIPWVDQVILCHLATGSSSLTSNTISAVLLHMMMGARLTFRDWKIEFVSGNPDIGIEVGMYPSEDFAIPLQLARKYLTGRYSYVALLSYIAIRNAEDSEGNFRSCLIGDFFVDMFHLYPDAKNCIGARALHTFLKSEQPFDAWKSEMIEVLRLVDGLHYFTNSTSHNPSRKKTKNIPPACMDVSLTLSAAALIGMASPTTRGRYFFEYITETIPTAGIAPSSNPNPYPIPRFSYGNPNNLSQSGATYSRLGY